MSRSARLLDLMQLLRRHRAPVSGQVLAEELSQLRDLTQILQLIRMVELQGNGECDLGVATQVASRTQVNGLGLRG